MATRISTASRNAAAAGVAALADAGAGAGIIQVRSGAQPTTAEDAATGTLLATFTLNDPAFGAPSIGVASLDADPAVTATGAAAGTAGWFRLLDSTGGKVLDGSVTATGGGGQLELNTTTVSVGLTLQITAMTINMPAA
jgi:hypothetical protein